MESIVQNKLDAPMPWIGMYIAAASLACSIAVTVDAFNGFRLKRLWLPCKYFSLNAFTLTLLAVVVKLPLDLTGTTFRINEKLARISSLVLVSISMANFMPSLGSMGNSEIILNVAALGVLVITVAVNVVIHNLQMSYFERTTLADEVVLTVLMLLLFVNMCSMAIMIPSAKGYIELKYKKMHTSIECGVPMNIREAVRRYWVMAATSSPQFVMARSAISATSGLLCLLMGLILVKAHAQVRSAYDYRHISSNYGWSIDWILCVQSVGVALGTIAPLSRWYVAAWFKFGEVFKTEKYWTSKLVEWRESSVPLQIQHVKFRKLLHNAKRLVLDICIDFQVLFVVTSKLVLRLFALCGGAIVLCFHNIKNFKRCDPNHTVGSESPAASQSNMSPFVLLLKGETNLPHTILKNICNEVDEIIEMGERKQPKNLIKLLHKSVNFKGVREFDSHEYLGKCFKVAPNCWSMPVVTLTIIALALPNVTSLEAYKQLVSGVSEGLSVVYLIEKTHEKTGKVKSIHDEVGTVWVSAELFNEWQGNDLQNMGTTRKETLQKFSSSAKDTITHLRKQTFKGQDNRGKLIAARSMDSVTQALLLSHKEDERNKDVFDRLSVMISDMLADCLTNLDDALRLTCYTSGIKERQESVREAATLVGESRQIFELLDQQRRARMQRNEVDSDDEDDEDIDQV